MVNLVDGNSGVYDLGLDGLLVDNWLNSLVDVMVDVLACNGSSLGSGVCGLVSGRGILKLLELSLHTLLCLSLVVVSELSLNLGDDVVNMLLRQLFSMLDWLNCGVVMILVNLSVNSLSGLLVSVGLHDLRDNSWVDILVDISCVALSGSDLMHCGSCGVHDE